MGEIIIGYDGSDSAKKALDQSLDFAKALGDNLVIVFGYAPGGYGGGEVPTQREAVHEFGEKVTAEATKAAGAAGIDSEVELINEHPEDALCDVAEKRKARMIVVGSYGEHPLKGALIGSTPYRLVHSAPVPVLVVRT